MENMSMHQVSRTLLFISFGIISHQNEHHLVYSEVALIALHTLSDVGQPYIQYGALVATYPIHGGHANHKSNMALQYSHISNMAPW